MTFGIPYARIVFVKGRQYAVCPVCKKRIPLTVAKDEDSMSTMPYAKHYASAHEVAS